MIGQDAADGPSLATVLDVEGRQELTRLLAEAMAAMRQQIEPAASVGSCTLFFPPSDHTR